jgi:hypothetical protein
LPLDFFVPSELCRPLLPFSLSLSRSRLSGCRVRRDAYVAASAKQNDQRTFCYILITTDVIMASDPVQYSLARRQIC